MTPSRFSLRSTLASSLAFASVAAPGVLVAAPAHAEEPISTDQGFDSKLHPATQVSPFVPQTRGIFSPVTF